MFQQLISEARIALKRDNARLHRARPSNNTKLKSLEADRPEISTVITGLPKRGYDGTAPYSNPTAARSTIGGGGHGQSSHT